MRPNTKNINKSAKSNRNLLFTTTICRKFRETFLKQSQTEFGKYAGISQHAVSAFERGKVDSLTIYLQYVKAGLDENAQEIIIEMYMDEIESRRIELLSIKAGSGNG